MKTKRNIKNLGVSTSLITADFGKILEKENLSKAYLRMLKDFTEFVSKNGFNMIEVEVISAIDSDSLLPIVKEIKKIISPFRTIYHLPLGEINISALNPSVRKEAIKETKKHIDFCYELGINKLVMHPGCFASMPDRYLLLMPMVRRVARQSIFEIFDYCGKKNMELSVENLHRNEPLFQKPEEFVPFIRKGLGMVLDTVHAFVANVEPVDFIKRFGKKITEVHLNDGIKSDPISHYPLGTGEVNCLATLLELEKMNFRGRVILEVESKEALIKSKKFLKQNGFL